MQAFFEKNVLFFAKKMKKKAKFPYFSRSLAVFHVPISCVPLKKSVTDLAFCPAWCTCFRGMKPSERAMVRYFLLSVTTVPGATLGIQDSISVA